MNMNLLLKNNSSPVIIIFFLSIIFVSCAIQKIEIPKPNLTMANKIQFDAESKEVWVYDFQGQGHYFNHATKNVINAFNNKTENINSQTFQLYCNYHTYNEMVFIEEKSVSVFKASTKFISNQKGDNINSNQSGMTNSRNSDNNSPSSSQSGSIKSSGSSGGSGNSQTTIPVDKKN